MPEGPFTLACNIQILTHMTSSILTLNDARSQKNAADARSEAKDTAAAAKRRETAAILRAYPQIGVLQRGTSPVYYAHVGVTRTYVEHRNIHEIVAAVASAVARGEDTGEAEYFAAAQTKADLWVPACGGKEVPTLVNGRSLLYCWNHARREHAYVDLRSDTVLSDDEASAIFRR